MALRDLGKKPVRASIVIFTLALALRLAWIAASAHELRSDELDYHKLASSLVQNASYAIDGVTTAYRPPGYPFALWMVYSVSGIDVTSGRIAQAVLDAMLAVLLFLAISGDHPLAASLAGLAWAVLPAAILYSGLLLSETVFTVILFGALLLFERSKGNTFAALSGLLLGFACLIKPWALVFVLFLAVFGLARKNPDRRLALATAVAVLTLLPWMLRNELQMGFFGLSTNTGMNLYVGNNPDATGGYRAAFPQEITSAAGDELRLDSVSTSLATEFVMREPLQFARNAALKAARLVASEGELLVLALSREPATVPYRERYGGLSLASKILVNAPSLVFLLLGVAGLASAAQSTQRSAATLLIGTILLTTVLFFGSSRFRFPAMPFMVMYGSLAATRLRSTVQDLSRTKKVLVACWVLLVAAVWTIELSILGHA